MTKIFARSTRIPESSRRTLNAFSSANAKPAQTRGGDAGGGSISTRGLRLSSRPIRRYRGAGVRVVSDRFVLRRTPDVREVEAGSYLRGVFKKWRAGVLEGIRRRSRCTASPAITDREVHRCGGLDARRSRHAGGNHFERRHRRLAAPCSILLPTGRRPRQDGLQHELVCRGRWY